MKTQINIFANLLLSEKYCANKARGCVLGDGHALGWDFHQLKRGERMQNIRRGAKGEYTEVNTLLTNILQFLEVGKGVFNIKDC